MPSVIAGRQPNSSVTRHFLPTKNLRAIVKGRPLLVKPFSGLGKHMSEKRGSRVGDGETARLNSVGKFELTDSHACWLPEKCTLSARPHTDVTTDFTSRDLMLSLCLSAATTADTLSACTTRPMYHRHVHAPADTLEVPLEFQFLPVSVTAQKDTQIRHPMTQLCYTCLHP